MHLFLNAMKAPKRRLKHDPANATFTVRFVCPSMDPEIIRLQTWSLAHLNARCDAIAAHRQEPTHV